MNNRLIRVLVIDDDEDDYVLTRDLLSEIQDARFEAEWVATYEAAVEAIGRNAHDVVLLDYYLGAQNGLELLGEALSKGCTVPLILLTGQADHSVDLEAMKAGAADYLTKGRLDAPLLERSIRYALERTRTLEALRESERRSACLYQQEQERNRKLQVLNKIFTAASVLDPDTLLEQVCHLLSEELGYYKVNLGQVDERQIHIEPHYRRLRGQEPDLTQPADLLDRRQRSLIVQAVNQQHLIYAPDVKHHPDYLPLPDTLIQSELAIPIISNQMSIGVLDVQSDQVNGLTEDDILLLSLLASQLAQALDNARLFQAIADEHNRLRTLIESSRSGIIMIGTDLRLLVANTLALEFLGLPGQPEDWIDRPLQDVLAALRRLTPAVVRMALAEIRRLRRGDELPGEGECELHARTLHWLNLPVLAGTTPLGRLLMLRDVTEERLLEKMRHDLTHMMVHDLRNPLTAISGSLEVLDIRVGPDLLPNQRRMLEIALENSATMLKLVNRILDMSQLESGQMPLERAPVSLAKLITETLQAQSLLAADKNLCLKSEMSPLLPPVWADVSLIGRVVQNLVSNAIKFTFPGNLVRVTIKEMAKQDNGQLSYLRVSVSDNGPGIPPELQSQIFQKFVTGRQGESGNGLGLAFCKLAIEAHGGRIWLESEPGQGATFIFTLPIAHDNV